MVNIVSRARGSLLTWQLVDSKTATVSDLLRAPILSHVTIIKEINLVERRRFEPLPGVSIYMIEVRDVHGRSFRRRAPESPSEPGEKS